MPDYAFNIGQKVYCRPSTRVSSGRRGLYQITERLRPEGASSGIESKVRTKIHERVVVERELRSMRAS
jgi:hypothetical protein